jgi:chloride channel protein, CIC family
MAVPQLGLKPRLADRVMECARWSPFGLSGVALVVGAGAGLGAVGFRWLIYSVTWLATGREEFGQQGRVASPHLPWLGIWFLLLIPVVGGLLYGPLIYRFAREARGHGVPEVMMAVATQDGRIRPQVSVVKALASALCIGTGGSVGREGPIVQIGSALASSLGQLARLPSPKLRVLVACGAAAGISATFNAPVTGALFGLELILREFAVDAICPVILSAVAADVIGRAFFGSAPIFGQMPHDLAIAHGADYLLVAFLGLAAGLIGVGFQLVLYKAEDVCDAVWKGRPEWARPAVGGVLLGLVLLALPQMYGVGYPVMNQAIAGNEALWFLLILMAAKIFTASLTIGIGGSGGVFAPSLFTGATAGTAFGVIARHLFGPAAGPPAVYGVIAMGAVFAAAAQAPLTSIASVVEMTGNYSLTVPVMLAVGIAAGLARQLSYSTIYTEKLLRRGIDIETPDRSGALDAAAHPYDGPLVKISPAESGNRGGKGAEASKDQNREIGHAGSAADLLIAHRPVEEGQIPSRPEPGDGRGERAEEIGGGGQGGADGKGCSPPSGDRADSHGDQHEVQPQQHQRHRDADRVARADGELETTPDEHADGDRGRQEEGLQGHGPGLLDQDRAPAQRQGG